MDTGYLGGCHEVLPWNILMKKLGNLEEIRTTVTFLTSGQAKYNTRQSPSCR